MGCLKEMVVPTMIDKLLKVYSGLTYRGFTRFVPNEPHLKLMYRNATGVWPDLDNPKTYGEKLQWMKLHDHNPLYPIICDKLRVKKWAAPIIGEEHIPKVLDSWKSVSDVDISGLPNKFVLKTNHDSSGVIVCQDKDVFNLKKAKQKLARQLKTDFYWGGREWPYREVPRRAFAEEFLECGPGDLVDYKIICFDGEPELVEVHKDRTTNQVMDLYTPEWDSLDYKWDLPRSGGVDPRPECWDAILFMTRKLSNGIRQVRVDWYIVNGKPFLGEMTLFDGSGFEAFEDREYDEHLGSLLRTDTVDY